MKRKFASKILGPACCAALAAVLPGCDELILSNLLLGARDGAVTATTGIVEGFFEKQFGLGAADAGDDEHAEEDEHGHADETAYATESGHDLFVRL